MYTFERFYYFRPYRGKSNFWLNRYGEGTISSHQKATLYTATGAADQRLQVHKVDGGCQLISALSTDFKDETKMFGLNIYGRKAGSICDFFPVYNNFDDALIDLLTVDAANSLYRIKLIKHDLYLTPASNANNAGLTWEVASGADNQVWQLCASQSSSGSSGEDSTGILNKDTTVPSAVAEKPFIITNIPDKQQASGFDTNVEFHPGCGFSDGTNFNTSAAGTAVKKVLQKYIKKVFGSDANLTDAQTCYYLYGERIANGTNQQFHPGVDINYYEGAPIYALYGGTVVYSGGTYGTVSIRVPSQNNIVTNYVHMKNIPVVKNQTVNAGQIIGYQSNAGVAATHLHFEIRPAGSTGPAGSSYNPSNPLTTIRPYGYMAGE